MKLETNASRNSFDSLLRYVKKIPGFIIYPLDSDRCSEIRHGDRAIVLEEGIVVSWKIIGKSGGSGFCNVNDYAVWYEWLIKLRHYSDI